MWKSSINRRGSLCWLCRCFTGWWSDHMRRMWKRISRVVSAKQVQKVSLRKLQVSIIILYIFVLIHFRHYHSLLVDVQLADWITVLLFVVSIQCWDTVNLLINKVSLNAVGIYHKCTNWHLRSALYSTQFDSTLTTTTLAHRDSTKRRGVFADCSNKRRGRLFEDLWYASRHCIRHRATTDRKGCCHRYCQFLATLSHNSKRFITF